MTAPADEIDRLLGPFAETVRPLRDARPAVVTHAQGSYDALFAPHDPRGVSIEHRHAIALRIATLADAPTLAEHHRSALPANLADAITSPTVTVDDPVLAALLTHTDLLTTHPADATRDDLAALHAAGLDTTDIVTAAQLIAFANFQLRVAAGLALLGADPDEKGP
jgi:uncharacterized protein YciW